MNVSPNPLEAARPDYHPPRRPTAEETARQHHERIHAEFAEQGRQERKIAAARQARARQDEARERDYERQLLGQGDQMFGRGEAPPPLGAGAPAGVDPERLRFEEAADAVLQRVRDVLSEKNRQYGNSALEPVRIFSRAAPLEQLDVRIDDKISRMKSGQPGDQEDAAFDLLGYLVLREVAKSWTA